MPIEYNFEIIFQKLEEAKVSQEEAVSQISTPSPEIEESLKVLRDYNNSLQNIEYSTYTRS